MVILTFLLCSARSSFHLSARWLSRRLVVLFQRYTCVLLSRKITKTSVRAHRCKSNPECPIFITYEGVLTVPVDLVFSVEMGSRCGCSTYAPLPQGITLS